MSVVAGPRLVGDLARKIADLTDQAIREHLGPDSTFEQRQDLAAAVTTDGLWFRSDRELHDAVTTAFDVEVAGRRYHRLDQASSATYQGRWGSHHIAEALYREVGVHNGPTIKPLELRVGIIEHMTPDLARIVGELSAEHSSRAVARAQTCEQAARGHATPPPATAHHYRMAWVGSTSIYDQQGNELHTWRYAAEASADPEEVAGRVAKDVAWIAATHRGVPIHCVQDGAPELRALPAALTATLPANRIPVVLVDLEHLMGYLDDVVDACHPDGDVHDWKGWYRARVLQDDAAIDQIWRNLRGVGNTLSGRGTKARNAVAAALSYILAA